MKIPGGVKRNEGLYPYDNDAIDKVVVSVVNTKIIPCDCSRLIRVARVASRVWLHLLDDSQGIPA